MANRAAGPFEIIEVLGEGTFGTVCVARVNGDPLRRRVALKILKAAYARNQKVLNRTRDEARLLSRLSHPNIVRVERLMDVLGRPVVVMEHVQGVSLDMLLARFRSGLPGAVALEITRLTCLALHVAYSETVTEDGTPLCVIHRDIKPSNIILSVHGEVKVVDFGIAKGEFDDREAHTESVVMGSRPYMAPERLDGISDDPSVDVYSAGMSMYELLTGRTMSLSINPITHAQAMKRQLKYIRVPGMSTEGLADLRELVAGMCAYEREQRPTAIEAAKCLEELVGTIEPPHRVGLEDFARTQVVPIYESRPRTRPEDMKRRDSDDPFLWELAGQSSEPRGDGKGRVGLGAWIPFVMVVAIVALLGALSAVGAYRWMGFGASLSTPVVGSSARAGKVKVKIWIPSDASARVGDEVLEAPGHVWVPPGTAWLDLRFTDGSAMRCGFPASDGIAVRYVVEHERGALSVDDGRATPCRSVERVGGG